MTPTIVYKDGGAHQRQGGTYSWRAVKTQEELDAALADGWFKSLVEAIAPKEKKDIKEPESNEGPTRDELLIKAKELNLEFPKNIPTSKLLAMVNEAI